MRPGSVISAGSRNVGSHCVLIVRACAVPKADWGVSLTHFYLAEDIVRQPLLLKGGLVALPDGPGLGIEVDEAAVERFRVR